MMIQFVLGEHGNFNFYFHFESVTPAGSIRSLVFLYLLYNIMPSGTLEVHVGVSECVCPGDSLILNCTVQGETYGATIWNGTAFNGCPRNEITLLHSDFESTMCNNGNIVVKSLEVDNANYTSQLNITITPDTAGKTIMCSYDAMTTDQTNDVIKLSTVVPGVTVFPPPTRLYLSTANFNSKCLKFTWSPVAPDCPAIHYKILASNCGSCPTTTNHTTVTCTDVPTDNSATVCTFAVQTVACGNLVGSLSDTINVTTTAIVIIKDSLSILITGGILLVLAVVLVIGCLLYTLTKRTKICTRSNRFEVPLQNSEEVSNTIYSVCERTSSNRLLDNKNRMISSCYKETPLELNRLLHTLKGQIADSQWYQFGLTIGVPKRVLNQVEHYSEEDRLAEVLDYWLKHHQGQPTWKEILDAKRNIEPPENMDVYSCLDTQSTDKGKDNQLSKSQRCTLSSSVNNPQSLYSGDVYDKTFH